MASIPTPASPKMKAFLDAFDPPPGYATFRETGPALPISLQAKFRVVQEGRRVPPAHTLARLATAVGRLGGPVKIDHFIMRPRIEKGLSTNVSLRVETEGVKVSFAGEDLSWPRRTEIVRSGKGRFPLALRFAHRLRPDGLREDHWSVRCSLRSEDDKMDPKGWEALEAGIMHVFAPWTSKREWVRIDFSKGVVQFVVLEDAPIELDPDVRDRLALNVDYELQPEKLQAVSLEV